MHVLRILRGTIGVITIAHHTPIIVKHMQRISNDAAQYLVAQKTLLRMNVTKVLVKVFVYIQTKHNAQERVS